MCSETDRGSWMEANTGKERKGRGMHDFYLNIRYTCTLRTNTSGDREETGRERERERDK